ncbi:MAG: peptide deformylase [Pirellulales bacterium]|nr:peptide deformylase [Pirellulales bacterium]
MPLEVIQYPHPALRHVSKPVKKLDAELRGWVEEMFSLMYAHKGIGLAANQVNLPYRLFVINEQGDPHKGEEFAIINPVLSRPKGLAEAEEGCLSLPGLYAEVRRPATIVLDGYDLRGKPLHWELDGLLARVVQHETDHLDGRLFVDRLNSTGQLRVQPFLQEFEIQYAQRTKEGAIPPATEIATRLAELQNARC